MRQSLGWLIHDEFGTDKDTIASISGRPLTRICLRSPGFQEFFQATRYCLKNILAHIQLSQCQCVLIN